MSIYRVLVEWTGEGKRQEGLIFFEAESLEKARAETQKIVDRVLSGVHDKRITTAAESCDPEFLVMWGKAEIDRIIQPNSSKMKPLVQTQPQPQPPVQAMSAGSSRNSIPQNRQGCFQSFLLYFAVQICAQ
jgi:hypothetical protein